MCAGAVHRYTIRCLRPHCENSGMTRPTISHIPMERCATAACNGMLNDTARSDSPHSTSAVHIERRTPGAARHTIPQHPQRATINQNITHGNPCGQPYMGPSALVASSPTSASVEPEQARCQQPG